MGERKEKGKEKRMREGKKNIKHYWTLNVNICRYICSILHSVNYFQFAYKSKSDSSFFSKSWYSHEFKSYCRANSVQSEHRSARNYASQRSAEFALASSAPRALCIPNGCTFQHCRAVLQCVIGRSENSEVCSRFSTWRRDKKRPSTVSFLVELQSPSEKFSRREWI